MGCRWVVSEDRPAESRLEPELPARAGALTAPYRAVTVAELTCRLNREDRTALLRGMRPAEDALPVAELLRREGRRPASPHPRHVAERELPVRPRHSERPSSGTPLVAPPPLHFTVRPVLRRTAAGSFRPGLGPLGVPAPRLSGPGRGGA